VGMKNWEDAIKMESEEVTKELRLQMDWE